MILSLVGLGLVLLGGLLALVLPRVAGAFYLSVVLGCALVATADVDVLVSGATPSFSTPDLFLSGVSLRLDALGAYVQGLVALVCLVSVIFLAGYARGRLATPAARGLVALFVVSLLLVPASGDVVSFLYAWELMALSSLVLVALVVERAAVRTAALWYAGVTQGGGALIIAGLVTGDRVFGSSSFSHWRGGHHGASLVAMLLLSSLGFLAKAGVAPLHVWLPRAHPEAPAPVSEMMSGAMTLLGVYGLLRFDVALAGAVAPWWWGVLTVVSSLSAVYAAIHAASASDAKRLLAYSTMEVTSTASSLVGLAVLAGEGSASSRSLLVAALGLVGAHALYKALLFLGVGRVERLVGTRSLDEWGGVLRAHPRAGGPVVIGALAAMGLPLTVGFVGEWWALQSLLRAVSERRWSLTLEAVVVLGALALSVGLVVVAMMKLAGIGILSRARREWRETQPPSGWMEITLGLLAVLVVLAGLVPGWMNAPSRAACVVARCPGSSTLDPWSLSASGGVLLRPALLALGGLALSAVIVFSRRISHSGVRATIAWACGRATLSPRMQYSASSFAEPVERVFVDVVRPDRNLDALDEVRSDHALALGGVREHRDAVEEHLYEPLAWGVRELARRARPAANGSVNLYATYGLLVLLVLLVVVGR